MRSKLIADSPKTVALILETGDEVLSSLKTFAQAEHLSSSSFKAIGALSHAEFGWFNWETQKYQTAVKLEEQVELLSLIRDIALKGQRASGPCPFLSLGAGMEPLMVDT